VNFEGTICATKRRATTNERCNVAIKRFNTQAQTTWSSERQRQVWLWYLLLVYISNRHHEWDLPSCRSCLQLELSMIGYVVSVDSCSRLVCLLTTLPRYSRQGNEGRMQTPSVVNSATRPPNCDGDVKTPGSAHSDAGEKTESKWVLPWEAAHVLISSRN
jgi:hypothetical protein